MKQRAGKKRPLQSRSAENLRPQHSTAPGSGRSELKSQMTGGGGVGKSRSAPELVSESLREREPHSPPRDKRYATRRAPPGRAGSAPPPTSVERPLSEEERERTVEYMHREFRARRKAVLNGLPPGTKEEVTLYHVFVFMLQFLLDTQNIIHPLPVGNVYTLCSSGHRHLSGGILLQDSVKTQGSFWYARPHLKISETHQ